MTEKKATLISTLAEIRAELASLRQSEAPPAAVAGPGETVVLRYTVGTGSFSADGRYILLKSQMFKMDGTPDGHHEGVFQSRFQDPSVLGQWPPPPAPPLDASGPVEAVEPRADTKAVWTFGDGSSIIAVGPAAVYVSPMPDGSSMFFVSVAGSITGGTGRFAGARGIKTALGGTHLEAGAPFGPGAEFPGRTIETFRIIGPAGS